MSRHASDWLATRPGAQRLCGWLERPGGRAKATLPDALRFMLRVHTNSMCHVTLQMRDVIIGCHGVMKRARLHYSANFLTKAPP